MARLGGNLFKTKTNHINFKENRKDLAQLSNEENVSFVSQETREKRLEKNLTQVSHKNSISADLWLLPSAEMILSHLMLFPLLILDTRRICHTFSIKL